MKPLIFLLFAIVIILFENHQAYAVFRQADTKDNRFIEQTVQIGSQQRVYRIYKPKNYKPGNPAVIILHGGTQSMRKLFSGRSGGSQEWLTVANEKGLLLVIPNASNADGEPAGNKQTWNDFRLSGSKETSNADDVTFINQLTDKIIAEYQPDKKRIYLTGASNGAMMIYRLLIETPEKYAAAATFISSLPIDSPAIKHFQTLKRTTPVFIMNGTKDPLIKWEGGEIPYRKGNMMPAALHAEWWARANKTVMDKASMEWVRTTRKDNNCTFQRIYYPPSATGSPVVFYIMHGGGHALPSYTHNIPDNLLVRNIIGYQCKNEEGARMAWNFLYPFTLQ